MTRLLIPTDNFPPRWDGIGRFLSAIVPQLSDYYVTIVAPNHGRFEVDSAEHIKLPLTETMIGDYTVPKPRLATIKREVKQADLVFGQSLGPIGSTAGHYARRTNTPLVHYTHSVEWQLVPEAAETTTLSRIIQTLTRCYATWYYNRTDKLITPSRSIEETLHYEGITTPTQIARLGVNHDAFKPLADCSPGEQQAVSRIRDGITNKEHLIGYHGRLAPEKDLRTLLRAVKRLGRRRNDFHVVLVGDGVDSIKDAFEADPRCSVISAQPNIHEYVQAFDVYTSTSKTETTSLSTVEAMACGKPVIATPAGYIADYIDHDENGVLIGFGDAFDLARQLDSLLDDEARQERLGGNAHRTAKQQFRWEHTAERIQGILDEMVS